MVTSRKSWYSVVFGKKRCELGGKCTRPGAKIELGRGREGLEKKVKKKSVKRCIWGQVRGLETFPVHWVGSTSKMNVYDRQYFFQFEHGNSIMK